MKLSALFLKIIAFVIVLSSLTACGGGGDGGNDGPPPGEPHKLIVSDNGIAFSSTNGLSNLSQSVVVDDSKNLAITWDAVSDQAWLTVTASGYTGESLTLTADPSGLTTGTIHYATVTISSDEASIANTEQIKVGFWVSTDTTNASDSLSLAYTEIVADPIRPYVYLHNSGTSIDVYNVHTASSVTTITSVGAQLGDMVVSSDGSTLYVSDLTNYDIIPVDLETLTVGSAWDLTGSGNLWLAYGRVNNRSLIFASDGTVYDAGDGTALSTTFLVGSYYYQGFVIDVSQNGKKLCGVVTGLSPYTIECFELSYSELNGGQLTMTSLGTGDFGVGSNAKDVALSHNGSMAYVASGAPYVFVGYETATMTEAQNLPADAYPNCVEISSDNLVYGGISGLYGPTDTWIYALNGVEQNNFYLSGYAKTIRDRQLVVSGDGLRMIVSVTDPAVKFITVP